MKTRICPLCDHPMTKKHRCDNCNSFIWKPEYIDIHYNSQTTGGEDCSYNKKDHDYVYHDDGSVTSMPSKKQKKFEDKPLEEPDNFDTYKKSYKEEGTFEKKRSSGKMVIIIAAILFLITSVPEIILGISGSIKKSNAQDHSYSYLETNDGNNGTDYGSSEEKTEYSDEEVIARGEECSGLGHLTAEKESFLQLLEPGLTQLGADVSNYNDTSYNYIYDFGYGDTRSYYSQQRMYDLEDSTGYYYAVEWDTVSGRLHEACYDVLGSENAESFFVITMQALNGDGESWRGAFEDGVKTAESEGYVFYDEGEYEIYISYTFYESSKEESYYISITKGM